MFRTEMNRLWPARTPPAAYLALALGALIPLAPPTVAAARRTRTTIRVPQNALSQQSVIRFPRALHLVAARRTRTTNRTQQNARRQQNILNQRQTGIRNEQRQLTQQESQLRLQEEDVQRMQWQGQTLDQLDQMVDLTPEQKHQIEPMLTAMGKQIEALDTRGNLSRAKKATEVQRLYAATWTKITPLLKPEQMDKIAQAGLLERLSKAVNLTAEQKSAIKPMLQDEGVQVQAVRDDASLTKDLQAARQQELDNAMWGQIDGVLTPEQRQKLDAIRQSQLLEGLTRSLTLTVAQQEKIKPLLEETARQVSVARDDASLSPAEKQARRQDINGAMWPKLRELLTAEQQQKFDAQRARAKGPGGKQGKAAGAPAGSEPAKP